MNNFACEIHYNSGKANNVFDTLSYDAHYYTSENPYEIVKRSVQFGDKSGNGKLSILIIQLTIMEAIQGDQLVHSLFEELNYNMRKEFYIIDNRVLGYKEERIYVPGDNDIKSQILYEAHNTPYRIHLVTIKMYRDLKSHFFCGKV